MAPHESELAVLKHRAEETTREFTVVWAAVDKIRDRLNAVEIRVALIVGAGTVLNAIVTALIVGKIKGS
jgi:hypothetical protein